MALSMQSSSASMTSAAEDVERLVRQLDSRGDTGFVRRTASSNAISNRLTGKADLGDPRADTRAFPDLSSGSSDDVDHPGGTTCWMTSARLEDLTTGWAMPSLTTVPISCGQTAAIFQASISSGKPKGMI